MKTGRLSILQTAIFITLISFVITSGIPAAAYAMPKASADMSEDSVTVREADTLTEGAEADSVEIQIPRLYKGKEIKPFARDIEQFVFLPKGVWITGVSVSYSQSNQDNYQFFIIESLNGDSYSFKVSPSLMYAFKDNLAAGGRFSYTRQRTRLNSADVIIDSETDYDIDNLYDISHNFSFTGVFRNYISLGSNTRFGLFNEVQLTVGGGQTKIANGRGEDLTGTYSRNFNLGVGLAPGIAVFLNNYSALEVNVGVLGFNYYHYHAITDQIYVANMKRQSANFKVNLFSITFGVMFYL